MAAQTTQYSVQALVPAGTLPVTAPPRPGDTSGTSPAEAGAQLLAAGRDAEWQAALGSPGWSVPTRVQNLGDLTAAQAAAFLLPESMQATMQRGTATVASTGAPSHATPGGPGDAYNAQGTFTAGTGVAPPRGSRTPQTGITAVEVDAYGQPISHTQFPGSGLPEGSASLNVELTVPELGMLVKFLQSMAELPKIEMGEPSTRSERLRMWQAAVSLLLDGTRPEVVDWWDWSVDRGQAAYQQWLDAPVTQKGKVNLGQGTKEVAAN